MSDSCGKAGGVGTIECGQIIKPMVLQARVKYCRGTSSNWIQLLRSRKSEKKKNTLDIYRFKKIKSSIVV